MTEKNSLTLGCSASVVMLRRVGGGDMMSMIDGGRGSVLTGGRIETY